MNTDVVIARIAGIRALAHKLILRELAERGVYDLAPSHGKILDELFHQNPLRMKQLALNTRRDKSTITALVDKLERLGYVSKQSASDDRRSTLVTLTAKGEELRPVFESVSGLLMVSLWRGFTESEKQMLMQGLDKILNNLRRVSPSPKVDRHRSISKNERPTP